MGTRDVVHLGGIRHMFRLLMSVCYYKSDFIRTNLLSKKITFANKGYLNDWLQLKKSNVRLNKPTNIHITTFQIIWKNQRVLSTVLSTVQQSFLGLPCLACLNVCDTQQHCWGCFGSWCYHVSSLWRQLKLFSDLLMTQAQPLHFGQGDHRPLRLSLEGQ